MNKEFLNELINSHKASKSFPSTFSVCKIIEELLGVLFPCQSKKHFKTPEEIDNTLNDILFKEIRNNPEELKQ